jgi:hypothetical protein
MKTKPRKKGGGAHGGAADPRHPWRQGLAIGKALPGTVAASRNCVDCGVSFQGRVIYTGPDRKRRCGPCHASQVF